MRVSLFGYGKTTKALAKKFGSVTFYDDKCHKPFRDENGYMVRPSSEFDPRYSDLEIPSPGIAPSNPLVKNAQNLISEYDFFASTMPRTIWISGTNGKTTTTQMLTHLLKEKGAVSGGNIGTPLAELDKDAPLWVLETSSFTLHYTNIAKPDIYLLLPVKPDHISWHGGLEAYKEAKLKPLHTMQEGEAVILPKEFANQKSDASLLGYDGIASLERYFGIKSEKVNFKGAFLLDAMLALAVEKILFDTISYEKINSFVLDPHRQEEFFDKDGRVWVNDTKATNVDATLAALQRYKDKKIHLILGGDDKGVELDGLFDFLTTIDVHTYHIGSNEKRLNALADKFAIPHAPCGELTKAVESIKQNLQKEQVALLSPAAASLDQFSSYAKRGELFKKMVLDKH